MEKSGMTLVYLLTGEDPFDTGFTNLTQTLVDEETLPREGGNPFISGLMIFSCAALFVLGFFLSSCIYHST